MAKLLYCPICAQRILSPLVNICPDCINYITPRETIHDAKYYRDKAMELFGDYSYSKKIIIDEEASKYPEFNPDNKEQNAKEEFDREQKAYWDDFGNRLIERECANRGMPKCPTCGSYDVKRISDLKRATHAYAFGLFSKTARSQFECKKCHYKW